MKFEHFEAKFVGHTDERVDVAVMPISSDLLENLNRHAFYRVIPSPMMCILDDFDDMDAIETVTFVGYPHGLYNEVNLLPFVRRGTTATPPMVDYNGLPSFLIDAAVFPGSSGSPVFMVGPSMRYRGRQAQFADRLQFVGIVASVWTIVQDLASSSISATVSSGISTKFEKEIGLGIVFKSTTIIETIRDHFFPGDALNVREPAPPTSPNG